MTALISVTDRPRRTFRSRCDSQERLRAADVQRSLLPVLPFEPVAGFTFTGAFQPVDFLGGDFYDVFRLDDVRVGFYLADVSGHDLAAALVTIWLRQLLNGLRAHDPQLMNSPARVFTQVQESMVADQLDSTFLTMAYGVLNTRTGTLRYATAGHPAPLQIRERAVTILSEANGPILSSQFGPEIGWSEETLHLQGDDGLLFYSDGVLDLTTCNGQPLGLGGLQAAVCDNGHSAAAIHTSVRQKSGGQLADDDLTLLLLRVGK
jgi:sigma-B regulation protein RsbU (phosphoserine phosphatase)